MRGADDTTADSAVRRRRVRVFEVFFTLLLVFAILFSALYWSDFSVSPGVSVRYVGYESTDGVLISGALFKPANPGGSEPGVVVVHGLGSYKESLNRLSVELARRGFVVLAIDLRDHGMSTGQSTFGHPDAEPEDVARGVEFLRQEDGVDRSRMAVVGHSFGGMVALTAASKSTTQVNATVTWAAPVNLTSLARDNREAIAFVADKRVLPPNLLDPAELAVRSPITYIASLRPNSTLFLHSLEDALVPTSQADEGYNLTRAQGQMIDFVGGVGHNMDSLEVLEKTIAFIELKTKGRSSEPLDPTYPAFTQDAAALAAFLTLLNLPVAWLAWEFVCTRDPQPVRLYNYPADRKRWKALAFASGDLAAVALLVPAAGTLVAPGGTPLLFAGTLPAPSLFSALLVGGLLLAAAAFASARAERTFRGRDDKRFEQGESLMRSTFVIIPVLLVIPLTAGLQYLLFLGANTPRSLAFVLAAVVLVLFTVGFEAFLRLRIQRRLRGIVDAVLGKSGLLSAVGNIAVGSLLYFGLIGWALLWLFRGYVSLPGDAAAFTLGVGVLSSLLFDRTKNIMPGALLSAGFFAWVLNAAFHF